MPWIDFTCCCGCGRKKRDYWRPGAYRPKFFSRECMAYPPPGSANRKYVFTPQMDAVIREAYSGVAPRGRVAATMAAHPLLRGIPPYMFAYRARRMGWVRERFPKNWTRREDAVLERHGGELCVEAIQRRLRKLGSHRSMAAISNRLWKRYRRGVRGQAYRAMDVARMLGWSLNMVLDWIAAGRLEAFRGGATGKVWRVTPAALAGFIRRDADLIGARRVDLEAVVRLLDDHPFAEGATKAG